MRRVTQSTQAEKGLEAGLLHHIRRIRWFTQKAPRQPQRSGIVALD